MSYILGIDIGTSGAKSALFSEKGQLIMSKSREYPLSQPKNGWAEQDPNDWWEAVCDIIKAVLNESGIKPDDIAGIGMSGQMHGLVMLDKDGKVLRPAILWCDQRTDKECTEIERIIGRKRLIEITANPALTGFTASKILWVRKHDPKSYENCCHILLPKDYIRYKLTGEFATDVSDASGMQLLDIGKRKWSDEVITKLKIPKRWLGRLYESSEVTGEVNLAAAEITGLKKGTIVVGGAGDNAAAAVGTGVVCDGMAFTTIGSSGVVYSHTSKMAIDGKGRVHTFCSAVTNEWHIMGVTQGAGLSLKWFREQFCADINVRAEKEGISPYKIMDDMAEKIPVGADGLIYLPYLMGERTPHLDPDCRGVFFGLSGTHTRAHLIRAVLEGVGYSLFDCVDILREMGLDISSMLVCGNGASPLWRQILADLYAVPVKTINTNEGAALGAALLAGVGAGIYTDVREAATATVNIESECVPTLGLSSKYKNIHGIYKKLYEDLKDSFTSLKSL